MSAERLPGSVWLHPGREKPVRQMHPWIFSGAIADVRGEPSPGELVDVFDNRSRWLARGYYNPRSQIVVRLLTWEEGEPVASEFWRRRLVAAAARRAGIGAGRETNAYRIAYAESDRLPGLIVDRYGDWLCVQYLTLGIEARRSELTAALREVFAPRGIIDRSDAVARKQEGLSTQTGLIWGEGPEDLEILENGLRFPVDIMHGQKTGFYLDQRENRRLVAQHVEGRRVLNAFSYTGAFGVYALAAGAVHVTNLDSSVEVLEQGEIALRLNGFDPDVQAEGVAGDVFQVLRALRAEGRQFDLIVLDPPKFARSRAEVPGALRGYKDINLLAFQLLAPGGLLATFSCSGLVDPALFQKVVFGASADAGRDAHILARLSHGVDHPLLLSFPEGEYLKGLLCRVVEQ